MIRYMARILGLKKVHVVLLERFLNTKMQPRNTNIKYVHISREKLYFLLPELIENGLIDEFILLISKEYYEKRRKKLLDELNERLNNNDECVMAYLGKELIGFCWLCFQENKYEPDIENCIYIKKDTSMIYNLKILKLFRGNGFASELILECLSYLNYKNYSRTLAMVAVDNIPSLNSFLKTGFKVKKSINLYRLFFLKKYSEH